MNIPFSQFKRCRVIAGCVMLGALAGPFSQNAGAENQIALATTEDPVVATINGEAVSAEEYRLVMQRQSATVFAWFKEHHNIEDHIGYWKDQPGAETPIEMLRKITLQELAEVKVCQGLAVEKGLLKDASFQSFRVDLNKENERRRAEADSGAVVYGPRQYRVAAYYYIKHGDLLFRLKNALAKEAEAGITDEMISEYREANKDSFSDKTEEEVTLKIRSILSQRRADEQVQLLQKTARIEVQEAALQGIAPRVDPE